MSEREEIERPRPHSLMPDGATTVCGMTTYEGRLFVATDKGVYRLEGDKLIKIHFTPPSKDKNES